MVSDNITPQATKIDAKGVTKVRQATKMSDVLRGVPGVNVNGARSVVERYNIRGVSEEYLTVTVDGARQNGYSFHHNGNYGIDPEILKRVDIDVGSNSVATGAGSLGGSIKFETVDAADMLEEGQNFGGKVKYAYGSNGDSDQAMAALYGRAGGLDLLGYFNYRNQGNGKDGRGYKNANDGHLQDYMFKVKYNISPDQWVKVSAERYTNTAFSCFRANMAQCIGDNPKDARKQYTQLRRKTYTIGYGYNPKENPWVNVKANAYSTETLVSSMGSPKSNVKTVGGTLSNESEFDLGMTHHTMLVGGEYYYTKSMTPSRAFEARSTSTSVYVEDQIGIGNFVIIPGVRYDHYRADFTENFDRTYHRFSKALGLKYSLTDDLVLFANYTELFKGPDVGEIVMASIGRLSYSSTLVATRGDNKEAGFTYAKDGIFGDDAFSLTAKYFHTNYDNISKSLKSASGNGSEYRNLGEVVLKGVEASAKYRYSNFTSAVTYARARSKQKETGYYAFPDTGDRYTLALNYYIPEAQVDLGWKTMLVREVYLPSDKETMRDSYAVSDAYVSWSPKQIKGLELTFGVDNIFNKAYKDHSTQYYGAVDYEPGRNYKLSASYKF